MTNRFGRFGFHEMCQGSLRTRHMSTFGYRAAQPQKHFNMARYCLAAAGRTPKKPALVVVDNEDAREPRELWTYAELEDAVLRLAQGLRRAGLRPGQRLLIRLENTSTYALTFFAAIAAGIVPVPVSDQLSAREAAFLIKDSGADAAALSPHLPIERIPPGIETFSPADIRRLLKSERAAFAETFAEDPAFLIYTSGTSDRPKGVLHAHRSAWGRRPMYQGWYGITPADRVLHAGAFNWTYTLGTGLADPWANGATAIVFTGAKHPPVWPRLISTQRATLFAAVPSLYRQILKYCDIDRYEFLSLRHGLCAGEALLPAIAEEWRARAGTPLYEALGQSEISTYISSSPSVPPKAGFVGRPQPGRCVVILPLEGGIAPLSAGEEGLIAVHRSDPGLMLGYWRRPEEEAEVLRGEWFIGGDLGLMDPDGYIAHRGRANELMNAGGYRVSPLEVEAALRGHPGIADVAVAEIEARPGVRIIAAFVVRAEGTCPGTDELDAFAAERLARYKRPREYVFVNALPRTPNGKVHRARLAALRRTG